MIFFLSDFSHKFFIVCDYLHLIYSLIILGVQKFSENFLSYFGAFIEIS